MKKNIKYLIFVIISHYIIGGTLKNISLRAEQIRLCKVALYIIIKGHQKNVLMTFIVIISKFLYFTATHSISTNAPFGNVFTATAERAGKG